MPQQSPTGNGIDIRDALEILSLRSNDKQTPTKSACCGHHPTEQATSWGQRIDIDPTESISIERMEEKKEEIEKERGARRDQVQNRMKTLSTRELVTLVIQTQADRVLAYRNYDSGLEDVLRTRNFAHYPQVCAEATATFSVLSDSINAAQNALKDQHEKGLIAKLQKAEKSKLNLTAALHLEKMRAAAQQQLEDDNGRSDGVRLSELHQRDVKTLKQNITSVVGEINDVLEELRFELLEDEE